MGRFNHLAAAVAATLLIGAETPPNPALQRLQSLQGRWTGPAVWEQGGQKNRVDFEVSYQVTSEGKAVLETMLPGSPGEMVTVYHLDGNDLVLVHYCSAGNQPRMKLDPADDSRVLAFRCLGGTNMTEADSHMHSVRITILDDDHIKAQWSSVKGDVVEWIADAELTRKK